jgi:hypothetical protein
MVTNEEWLRRGLPVAGEQDAQIVLVGHGRKAAEDVAQVGESNTSGLTSHLRAPGL